MTFGASSPDPAPPGSELVASVVPLVPAWRLDRAFDYLAPPGLEVAVGSLVRVPLGGRRVRGIVIGLERRAPGRALAAIGALVVGPALCPPPHDRLLEWVAERYCAPRGLAFGRAVPARVRVEAGPTVALSDGPGPSRILSYRGGHDLVSDLAAGRAGGWCLQARPGEDRGALVCELVAAAGRGGGAALVSVPEVRYGSPVLDALARAWPHLARLDAAVSARARSEGWLRLASGHGLGAGGRSALLAPAPGLRLVVVDDEHHQAYKEDRSPRFHARRVALERARLQGALCVLASSTPSLETVLAARRGRLRQAEPEREAMRAARPLVEVLPRPRGHPLGDGVARRVTGALRAGQRVALLAPARGYARALWCGSCRRSLRCPRCETGLAYDRRSPPPARGGPPGGPSLRCPRCAYTSRPPGRCPRCGAAEWRYLGAGSERLAEQVRRAWPRARVARTDPDVMAEGAGDRPPDIYVTTWVGTKEVLRPPVSVVVVLDADALLRRPEWWAAEAGYQALAEMASWAGPASAGGRLVVQCSEPAHHAVQAVVRADHRFFCDRELEQRAELYYPPFSELVRAAARGAGAPGLLERVAAEARSAGAAVLGPTRPALGSRGEVELLAKCPDAHEVAVRLRGILGEVPAGTWLRIDVDPR